MAKGLLGVYVFYGIIALLSVGLGAGFMVMRELCMSKQTDAVVDGTWVLCECAKSTTSANFEVYKG